LALSSETFHFLKGAETGVYPLYCSLVALETDSPVSSGPLRACGGVSRGGGPGGPRHVNSVRVGVPGVSTGGAGGGGGGWGRTGGRDAETPF
jgi:hypothetical protein